MMRKVFTDFPFDDCGKCELLEADMNLHKLYADDDLVETDITVFCRKSKICTRLWEKLTNKMKEEKKDAAE